MKQNIELYNVVLYFESKYAFKRKYTKDLITDQGKLPSFLNENIFLNNLLTGIIHYHIENNFNNFKSYTLNDGDISPIRVSSPLKKMFFNSPKDNVLPEKITSPLKKMFFNSPKDDIFEKEITSTKRYGLISPDKNNSIFPRMLNGKTIEELRESFNLGITGDDDNLFSGESMSRLITDDSLFTIASLKITPDLFTSCRIFILLDNLFDKLNRIYNDIEDGIVDYNKILSELTKSKKDCEEEYFKNNPTKCRWFDTLMQQTFTLGKYLENIHFVLYIYTINTVLYCPIEMDTIFYSKMKLDKKTMFASKFSKCFKNVIYHSKTKNSYMICDTSTKDTIENSYENLNTFEGILRLFAITKQLRDSVN